jgi:hypothetical protein
VDHRKSFPEAEPIEQNVQNEREKGIGIYSDFIDLVNRDAIGEKSTERQIDLSPKIR